MHFRRTRLLAAVLVARWIVRVAPIALCVVLASKLRVAQAPIVAMPADPTPLPIPSEIAPPPPLPVRAAPPVDALTTSFVFNDVRMVTAQVGWAWGADSALSRTDDGGRTWTIVGPVKPGNGPGKAKKAAYARDLDERANVKRMFGK